MSTIIQYTPTKRWNKPFHEMITIAQGVAAFAAKAGAVGIQPTVQNMAIYVGRQHLPMHKMWSIKPQAQCQEKCSVTANKTFVEVCGG